MSYTLLKLLARPLATFKLTPLGVYTKKTGYEALISETNGKEEEEMEE